MCRCLAHCKHYVLAILKGEGRGVDHCQCGPREGWAGMRSWPAMVMTGLGERAAAWQV